MYDILVSDRALISAFAYTCSNASSLGCPSIVADCSALSGQSPEHVPKLGLISEKGPGVTIPMLDLRAISPQTL
jgi:hypothetical protein